MLPRMVRQCWRQAHLMSLTRNVRKAASLGRAPTGPLVGLSPRRPRPASALRQRSLGPACAISTEAAAEVESDGAHAPASVLEERLTWPGRTHGCGTVGETDIGQQMTVCGWVDRYRNLGGILFLDIRDHTGIVQVGGQAYCK
jgi:aspartyl-tRNA synthetase